MRVREGGLRLGVWVYSGEERVEVILASPGHHAGSRASVLARRLEAPLGRMAQTNLPGENAEVLHPRATAVRLSMQRRSHARQGAEALGNRAARAP